MPPVEDHPVHERVRVGDNFRNGCHNKPRPTHRRGYFAPDREYEHDGTYRTVQRFIPFRMSTECRYDQAINPEHCAGCQHLGSGQTYTESVIHKAGGTK